MLLLTVKHVLLVPLFFGCLCTTGHLRCPELLFFALCTTTMHSTFARRDNVTEYVAATTNKLPVHLLKVFENSISLHFTNRSDKITLVCQDPQVQPKLPTSVCDISISDVAFWTSALIIYITLLALLLTVCGTCTHPFRSIKCISESHVSKNILRHSDASTSEQFTTLTEKHVIRSKE